MVWFLKKFWGLIALIGTIVGLYYLPADIGTAEDAAEPWRRVIAMVDKDTAVLAVAIFAILLVFCSEAKPLVSQYLFKPKWQRPVRGALPAYVHIGVNTGTRSPILLEQFNVARFYLDEHSDRRLLFLVFESDAGREVISVTDSNGKALLHRVIDTGPRSLVIRLDAPFTTTSGVRVYCHNNDDKKMAPLYEPKSLDRSPELRLETAKEKQR